MTMDYVLQFVLAFVATVAFGVIFNAPRKVLVFCGFTGGFGWIVYSLSLQFLDQVILATFFGSFALTFVAYIFARKMKIPVLIFIVCGIIPLVPGGLAYEAMRNIVTNQYNDAIEYIFQVALISGSIAIGIIFSEMTNQLYSFLKRKLAFK